MYFGGIHLRKEYLLGEVPLVALDQVTCEFFQGEFVLVLGPSGSGKSTLLNLLGGLDIPTSGEVIFKGKKISPASDKELTLFRRNMVGFVFQYYNLLPSLTALENVELVAGLVENPLPPLEALKLVDLENRKDHFPSQLSGGEQQRVAIARAITKNPHLLLCDEPTGALDIRTGRVVLDAIQKINKELGTTTIIITHNSAISEIADRVIVIQDGKITKDRKNPKKKSVQEIIW